MKSQLLKLSRVLAIIGAVGTATFSVVRADEIQNYSCCGTGSTPTAERCRYTDRGIECTDGNDAICANDGEFRLCCPDACFKMGEAN